MKRARWAEGRTPRIDAPAATALGWPDAFPASDVGVMKALGVSTAREALVAAEAWRPWRAYAALHLWASDPQAPAPAKVKTDARAAA